MNLIEFDKQINLIENIKNSDNIFYGITDFEKYKEYNLTY